MKCPKCGKEIVCLKNYSKCEEVYDFSVDKNGQAEYYLIDSISGNINDYECPECNEVLFTLEEEALKFLKGE